MQQRQHLLFQCMRVDPFFDDVILVEDIAHKVAVIELVHQLAVNFRRQMLKPFGVVATQGNIQRQNILHLFGMHRLVTDSGTRRGEAVQEGFAAFFRRTGKEIPVGGFEELGKPGLCFGNSVPGHFQQQVVLIFVAPGLHAFREMRREDVAQLLHKAVGKVGFEQRHFLQHRVGAALHGEEERHFVGAELVDHQEGIFAVAFGDVVNIPVHILARHRQVSELGQNMTADLRQHLRLVGADVKHLLLFLCREGIKAHRKNGQFARAAGGFKQAIRVGVVARWGIGLDIAHAGDVIVVMRVTTVVLHVFVLHPVVVELAENLFWRHAEIDTQVVHQRQLAVFIDTGKQRHFSVSRAALHQ